MLKVVITELEYEKALDIFSRSAGFEFIPTAADEDSVAQALKKSGAAAVILGVRKYTDKLYEALPEGGLIARFGVGHDGVDKAKAQAKNIYCINTPGALDDSVAECAVGLMLAVVRKLVTHGADLKNGHWHNCGGAELSGKTLAIIGCGHIGLRVAKICRDGFGMKVIGNDLNKPAQIDYYDSFCESFAQAVENADFVSLHIPHIKETENFINAERLAMMNRKAALINTSRGAVLDEDALYDALSSGVIAAAGLDVFKFEPYDPQSPERDLRKLRQVVLTPHIGSSTADACRRMAESLITDLRLYTNGQYGKMHLLQS